MNKTLFRQSDIADPYAHYRERLAGSAMYWDGDDDCWAVYSYEVCERLLKSPGALIPFSSSDGLGEYARWLKSRLVRLQNPPLHKDLREVTGSFFGDMRPPDWPGLLRQLLPSSSGPLDLDWVEMVARRLPVLGIMDGFGFDLEEQQRVLKAMPDLVKIMQPANKSMDTSPIDQAVATVGRCLAKKLPEAAIGAVAGVLIQGYDAGRGLLCNALLHACAMDLPRDWRSFVTEVLRFDSPVHHTRRIAGEDMHMEGQMIKKGEMIVLVVAAANRDETHFRAACSFDADRTNNEEHLSFGSGPHACMASDLATTMTADCLEYVFKNYGNVYISEKKIVYEPLVNIRSPQRLGVCLTA